MAISSNDNLLLGYRTVLRHPAAAAAEAVSIYADVIEVNLRADDVVTIVDIQTDEQHLVRATAVAIGGVSSSDSQPSKIVGAINFRYSIRFLINAFSCVTTLWFKKTRQLCRTITTTQFSRF